MDDTVLIAGAGLSSVAGLPTTRRLTAQFLTLPETDATSNDVQKAISRHLRQYWETVFEYRDTGPEPSFEDHFTVLDLAANTGHHLGVRYNPKQLRAIRRLSIHRVFDILDLKFTVNGRLTDFLARLARGNRNAIVTTNWDIAIERHLNGCPYHYSIPMARLNRGQHDQAGLPVLKLHGSSNWAYCDCCGRLFAFDLGQGKGALHKHILIDDADLRLLDSSDPHPAVLSLPPKAECPWCKVSLSSRVATFSYAKVLGFVHFLGVWDNAFKSLRDASNWIFLGYSFPESDFQLRHMLKAAQLGRAPGSNVKITVVVKDDQAAVERFRRFFGAAVVVAERGFDDWVNNLSSAA